MIMKKILLLVAIAAFSLIGFSQSLTPIPDFGLVSRDNDTVYLYEDILDQNKTAVLIFYNVTCHFCQDEVPAVNNLYNQFNQNQDDVYIWVIEIGSSSQYSPHIVNFENTYGSEYESFNASSTDSVQQLLNVFAYPYYVVACPDGSFTKGQMGIVQTTIANCQASDIETIDVSSSFVCCQNGQFVFKPYDNTQYNVEMYTIDGRLVHSEKFVGEQTVDFESKGGIYIYRISDEDGNYAAGKVFKP